MNKDITDTPLIIVKKIILYGDCILSLKNKSSITNNVL